jgi:alpha-tubulin suppressor-like RCC1 family protein
MYSPRHRRCLWRSAAAAPLLLVVACTDSSTTEPEPEGPIAKELTIAPIPGALTWIGEMVQLGATALDATGAAVGGLEITWSSSAPDVVEVDTEGHAVARSPGEATLTATIAEPSLSASAAINVSPVPSKLVFRTAPEGALADSVLTPAVAIELLDAGEHRVESAVDEVILTLGENIGGGSLRGKLATRAVDGVATFTDLSVDRAGTGYVLIASAAGLEPVQSQTFDIAAPATEDGPADDAEDPPDDSGDPPGAGTGLQFRSLSAGRWHVCAIAMNGEAYCWGRNHMGQLGNGGKMDQSTPAAVSGGLKFQSLSAGWSDHTCGITEGGTAYCWGWSYSGELGQGESKDFMTMVPLPVEGARSYREISTGFFNSCAITSGNAAFCWGHNGYGQLGDGSNQRSNVPVAVDGSHLFRAVSAGYDYACGITSASKAYCWGANNLGQLGVGSVSGPQAVNSHPAPVAGGHVFDTIDTGESNTCALTTADELYCWGSNWSGQLGSGQELRDTIAEPVQIHTGHTFTMITVGDSHICGLKSSGKAYCWGENLYGQLGGGERSDDPVPELVEVAGGHHFVTLSAGERFTCGLTTAGDAYCWGGNMYGQLGDGTEELRAAPVRVSTRKTEE